MSKDKIVLSNWLTDRFEIDSLARNKNVENHFLQLINNRQSLNLIDLGTGTGGNLIYLLPKIACNQNWYLVEQDAGLIESCKQRTKETFPQARFSENKANFKVGDNHVNLKWFHTDMIHFLKSKTAANSIDVITASALFDVLPNTAFEEILNFTRVNNLLLFSTLNYEDTKFEHATDEDVHYAKLYQQHMKLPQTFGIKMGGDCKTEMLNMLNEIENQKLVLGQSDWLLNHQHPTMLRQLVQFFSESIPDLLKHTNEQRSFKNWVNLKLRQISKNELTIMVKHFDFLLDKRLQN